VASVTLFDPPTALTDAGNLEVKGSISASSSEGFLQLSWLHPELVYLGDYNCEVSGVDARGHTKTLTSTLTLTSAPPSLADVIDVFSKKFHEQQATNSKLQNDNDHLTKKLKTCFSAFVAFDAAISYSRFSSYTLSIPSGQTVVFDDVSINQGGAYDSSTGVFTCSVTGVYEFQVHAQGAAGKYVILQLEKNGQELFDLVADNEDFVDAFLSHIVRLSVGDTVSVKCTYPSVMYAEGSGSNWYRLNYFTGKLLHIQDCLP